MKKDYRIFTFSELLFTTKMHKGASEETLYHEGPRELVKTQKFIDEKLAEGYYLQSRYTRTSANRVLEGKGCSYEELWANSILCFTNKPAWSQPLANSFEEPWD